MGVQEPMTEAARGRFITLEGGEGAGKSSQADRLAAKLKSLGLKVVRTREPGGSPRAELLREAILSGFAAEFGPEGEALLFAAARIDHIDKTIAPALGSGTWVVCDRFADSTRAYQGAAGKLPQGWVERLEQVTLGPLRPNLTLVLDIPPEVGLERARRRRGAARADRFEVEGVPFHQTLRRAFLAIAASEPERCAVVDATKTEEEVAADVWSAVEARLDPARALHPA